MPNGGNLGFMSELGRRILRIGGFDGPVGQAVLALASTQHWVVTRVQLLAIGMGPKMVDSWLRAGRLHRIHRGVYAVGRPDLPLRGRWLAAVYACGPEALLSHRDAGVLADIRASSRWAIDVTAPRSREGQHGITLHRPRNLHPDERDEIDGIPVTSVARTLLDLADVVPTRHLQRTFEEAQRLGKLDGAALTATLARCRNRRGHRQLTELLATIHQPRYTRSELEALFLDLCREAGLPEPAVNIWLPEADGEVDFLWRDQRLVVELDSRGFHSDPAAFERDRERDTKLQRAGYRVIRITHHRLTTWPDAVRDDLAALLGTDLPTRPPSP